MPAPARATITSLPENACQLLSAAQLSAAIGKGVTRGRRVPDIGEILRADNEGRVPRERAVCSYDTVNEFGSIVIIVPSVSQQNPAAFQRARDEYSQRSHAEQIEGLGEDAWVESGGAVHVLAGKNAQFIVATRTPREMSREMLIATARAVVARLGL
ncbi:MAG: hypothetical protein ABR582_02470 [Gemmatimonadaceae bacterium]